jgi:HlyD family secretion protein
MAQNNRRRNILVGVVVLAVVGIAILSTHKRAPAVPVVQITRENLSVNITSNGKVEPISPDIARAQFPSFVTKVLAVEGQSVHRGQLILTLDSTDVRSQLAQAQADLLAAQTDLRNARAGGPPDQVAQLNGDLKAAKVEVENLERTQKALANLVAVHAATQEELAQNQANLEKAMAHQQALEKRKDALEQSAAVNSESYGLRVSQAQDQVKSLEDKVRSATVVAKIDGTLYSLPVRAGDYVKVGDTLAEMADLRHVRVRAFVDEPDLGALEPNQAVEVTWDAKPNRTWTGHTEQIPKQVVARGMRSVGEVLCSVDNDQLELLPNVNVQVRILVRQREDTLVVPRGAVHENGGEHYVFLVNDDDTVHRRDISVGIANASLYEVLSGLTTEDRVALPEDGELRDGMKVRPTEAE